MDRAQKEGVVEELGRIFADSGVVVVAHYEGLSVAEMTNFRLKLKQAGGGVRVAKNKLAKIALKGTPGEKMGDLLTGMTVLAYSEDPVAAAKAVEDFTKVNKKLVVLGGAMGATSLDQAGVTAVAAMPSREELIASIVATIGGPGGAVGFGDRCTCGEHRVDPHHSRGARGGLTATLKARVRQDLAAPVNTPYLIGNLTWLT